MESIQYNAALAITGAIRGTSREKRYQEVGLDSLRKRRWYKKLCYFFKNLKANLQSISSGILPGVSKAYNTRTNGKIPLLRKVFWNL